MSYRVDWQRRAVKELEAIPQPARGRLLAAALALGDHPRPPGWKPLRGGLEGQARIRVGEYRIAYHVDDGARLVTILAVSSRGGAY